MKPCAALWLGSRKRSVRPMAREKGPCDYATNQSSTRPNPANSRDTPASFVPEVKTARSGRWREGSLAAPSPRTRTNWRAMASPRTMQSGFISFLSFAM